jgi:pyrroloquinoline quinone biosynthesis protein B
MRVRLLGSAAGGALPQWNCNCDNCRAARANSPNLKPRTQSCIAVSNDDARWFLINASPDLHQQIESFPPLWPPTDLSRGSAIAGVLLTNADLDHTLGLFLLREGRQLNVHATASVRHALQDGLNLDSVLNCYSGIEWREPSIELTSLLDSGLSYCGFLVPGKPPRYRPGASPSPGDAIGYRIIDEKTGGRLVVIPDAAAIDENVARQLVDADVLMFDGTFFDDDELQRICPDAPSAHEMGHLPIGGSDGSLSHLAPLSAVRRVYVHINNTNPMLRQNSPQRVVVEAAGIIVGEDGMEFTL